MKKNLVILSGKINSGKSTAAKYIVNQFNYSKTAFAEHLKNTLYTFLQSQNINISLEDFYTEEGKDKIIPLRFPNNLPSTVRGSMQWWGELMKEQLGDNFWIKYVIKKIQDSSSNYIIEDARFEYEITQIRDSLLQFNYNIFTINIVSSRSKNNNHISETHLDNYNKFDFTIYNDNSLEDLYNNINNILNLISGVYEN